MRVPRYVPPEDLALSDEAADRFLADLEERPYVPPFWTAEYAGVCLVEAADIMRRQRMSIGPGALRGQQIAYNQDDLPEILKREINAYHIEMDGKRSRPAQPTRAEMQKADRVMRWPMRFLKDDADTAACVTYWAHWTACELDVAALADVNYVERRYVFDAKKNAGLQVIADGLNAAKEAPF